ASIGWSLLAGGDFGLDVIVGDQGEAVLESRLVEAKELVVGAELGVGGRFLFGLGVPGAGAVGDRNQQRRRVLHVDVDAAAVAVEAAIERHLDSEGQAA